MSKISLFILIPFLWACDGTGSIENNNNDAGSDSSSKQDVGPEDMNQETKDMAGMEDTNPNTDVSDTSTSNDASSDAATDADADMEMPGPVEVRVVLGEREGKLSTWIFNQETRTLTPVDEDTTAPRISWVAKHPDENVFYTTSQSTIRGYTIDDAGAITYQSDAALNEGGTHLEIDKSGQWAITASYGGGNIEVVSLDGVTKLPDSVTQNLNAADFCTRAHQVRISSDNSYVYVPCLGNDYVRAMTFDQATGTLTPTTPGSTPAGAGPRHMDFHPSLDFAYVLNETASSITRFDSGTGALLNPVTVTTLPAGVNAGSASSDINISKDGNFLYAVNRQPRHEMAVFQIGGDGSLTLVEHVPGAGEHARSFAISPDGKSLLMGNTNSSNLIIFQRDPESGKLVFGSSIDLAGGPMFVGFL